MKQLGFGGAYSVKGITAETCAVLRHQRYAIGGFNFLLQLCKCPRSSHGTLLEVGHLEQVAPVHWSNDHTIRSATDIVNSLLSLQYSREDETEADLGGLSYMTQVGYDPNGMVETMEILEKLQTIRPIEFFSTHPSLENRVARLMRMQQEMEGI